MKKKAKVLDTFSGAGGFSLGFQMAGAEVIGAIESDLWACETFKANHPKAKVIHSDIKKLNDSKIRELFGKSKIDIVLGGPPCQGYSIANKKSGDPKDPRNSLFEEFLRIGKILNPQVMIMENVPNLINSRTQNGEFVLTIITQELEKLGYDVQHKVLEATSYGVPQIRKRLFVVASKIKLKSFFPEPTHCINNTKDLFTNKLDSCPTLWDAISDLPELEAREVGEVLQYTLPAINKLQKTMRIGSKILFNHKAMNHSKRLVERFSSMKWS